MNNKLVTKRLINSIQMTGISDICDPMIHTHHSGQYSQTCV